MCFPTDIIFIAEHLSTSFVLKFCSNDIVKSKIYSFTRWFQYKMFSSSTMIFQNAVFTLSSAILFV